MRAMGISVKSDTQEYGFYPKGGGRIGVDVNPPAKLKALSIEKRGKPLWTEVWSNASRELLRPKVAERQIGGAKVMMKIDKENVKYVEAQSVGSAITIVSKFSNCFLGSSALGERSIPAEKVGEAAAAELARVISSGATMDCHMSDQILPYLALAPGKSVFIAPELTSHIKTSIWVIEKFLEAKFGIEYGEKNAIITCSGSPA